MEIFKRKITKKQIIIGIVIISIIIASYLVYKQMQGNSIIDPGTATASDNLINYIENAEGLKLTAYQDSGGIWTIGYGHTGNDVYQGLTITQQQAEQLLRNDVQNAVATVISVVNVQMTQNKLDGLTDFIYNTGAYTSNVFKYVNNNDWAGAANFLQTHYITDSKGTSLPGLVTRRNYEANLIS